MRPRARLSPLLAALLLIVALLTIWTMQRLYAHRLITYDATRYFFAASKRLRAQAKKLVNRRTCFSTPFGHIPTDQSEKAPATGRSGLLKVAQTRVFNLYIDARRSKKSMNHR